MKKDYSFLNKVIIFDNNGKTNDRYTICLPDGTAIASNSNPTHPAFGFYQYIDSISFNNIGFGGSDGDADHTDDKEEIKAINKANRHIGKYKTINAMKRLPKELLNCIKWETKKQEVLSLFFNDLEDSEYFKNKKITEKLLIKKDYSMQDIGIIKQYTNYL